ncbi:MAG: hypothetical protein R3Y10_06430 [Ferrimonas sp.]
MTLASDIFSLRQWVSVAHHIPGRIRLKFNSVLLARFAHTQTEQALQQAMNYPSLIHYQLNPESGSLVLQYDATMLPPSLLDDLFTGQPELAQQAYQRLLGLLPPDDLTGANHHVS